MPGFIAFCGALLIVSIIYIPAQCQSTEAGSEHAKNAVFLSLDTTLESIIYPGFSNSLASHLVHNLTASGISAASMGWPGKVPAAMDSSVLAVTVSGRRDSLFQRSVVASVSPLYLIKKAAAFNGQPPALVKVDFSPADSATFAILVAKKIAENLRINYTRRLVIQSSPSMAQVKSTTGLSGVCPVEWNVPFGIIGIEAYKKGFLTKTIRMDLTKPLRQDTIIISLVRRMPYHSRWFVPAVSCAALSLGLYGGEYYYYQRYKQLTAEDLKNRPEAFQSTFNSARACEYGAGIAIGCAAGLFCLTFFF
jgi:hypothetical protein